MKKYDAIVIGAGHNGLTNAAYLAKAGLDVVIVEKNDYIGGAAVSRELHEGWTYSSCSYVCSMMRQALHRDLDLSRHGLILVPYLGAVNFADDGHRRCYVRHPIRHLYGHEIYMNYCFLPNSSGHWVREKFTSMSVSSR